MLVLSFAFHSSSAFLSYNIFFATYVLNSTDLRTKRNPYYYQFNDLGVGPSLKGILSCGPLRRLGCGLPGTAASYPGRRSHWDTVPCPGSSVRLCVHRCPRWFVGSRGLSHNPSPGCHQMAYMDQRLLLSFFCQMANRNNSSILKPSFLCPLVCFVL